MTAGGETHPTNAGELEEVSQDPTETRQRKEPSETLAKSLGCWTALPEADSQLCSLACWLCDLRRVA